MVGAATLAHALGLGTAQWRHPCAREFWQAEVEPARCSSPSRSAGSLTRRPLRHRGRGEDLRIDGAGWSQVGFLPGATDQGRAA